MARKLNIYIHGYGRDMAPISGGRRPEAHNAKESPIVKDKIGSIGYVKERARHYADMGMTAANMRGDLRAEGADASEIQIANEEFEKQKLKNKNRR